MKAVCWQGKNEVSVDEVPDPTIEDPRDAIVQITSTAICGSDLHLYDGFIPEMRKGDVLGHEFMGEIVATGPGVTKFKQGDRVLVPFNIACGKAPEHGAGIRHTTHIPAHHSIAGKRLLAFMP